MCKGNGVCFFCGFEFEDCDLPRLVESRYGNRWEYEGRKEIKQEYWKGRPYRQQTTTSHDHDRLTVPFLPGLFLCRDCFSTARATGNTFGSGKYVHPSIRALDAARERRLKQLDDAVPKPYNPKTWNHPSLRKWDAAVRAGKIDLGIIARYRLVPTAPKVGKGVKGIAVSCETMTAEEAEAFREAIAQRRAARLERERQYAEYVKAKLEGQAATETAPVTAAA